MTTMRGSIPNPSRPRVDSALLWEFKSKIESRAPRLGFDGSPSNPTPLIDITEPLLECAKEEYGLDLGAKNVRVYGKFEGQLLGGSVKTRPAIKIIGDAISSGLLTRDKVVFEATSGNFGISLGLLNQLGLKVIALVSRRLQDGVLKGLDASDVKTMT